MQIYVDGFAKILYNTNGKEVLIYMDKIRIEITNLEHPTSVKEYLLSHGYSVTFIKKVKFGRILLGRVPVTVRAMLKNGDVLELVPPSSESDSIAPIDIPIPVLYEDDYVVAFDKPTNMPTHPSRGNSLPTLANAAIAKYGKSFVFRSITRLDRDTSGIVLIAKDQVSAHRLSRDMKQGKFNKKYRCTVSGTPSPEHALIDAPIRREHEASMKRIVAPDGKQALTEYTVISSNANTSECEVILHTGRTHQIRVHMAYIGHPLAGDFLYGERSDEGYKLRCVELSFPHPETQETITVKA